MTTAAHGLAETFVRMLNEHNPDLVDQFVARDYRNHNAFVGDGREANRTFWSGSFTALPDVTATMEDLVIAGDRVVGRFVYRGTHAGEFMGIPATGRRVEMRSIDIWRVENGMCGADPATLATEIMASPEFMAEMEGFDPHDILAVDSVLLDPTESSPMR